MWLRSGGTNLRQKERCYEEGMCGQFDQAHFRIWTDAGDTQLAAGKYFLVNGIEPVIAGKLLRNGVLPIDLLRHRAWPQRHALVGAHERTAQAADEQRGRVGCGFLMLRLLDPQYVACILYQSMLESPSGADKRPSSLTGISDPSKRAIHALIGASRRAPQRVELPKDILRLCFFQRRCRQPHYVHTQ
jgi:hypothetical protein